MKWKTSFNWHDAIILAFGFNQSANFWDIEKEIKGVAPPSKNPNHNIENFNDAIKACEVFDRDIELAVDAYLDSSKINNTLLEVHWLARRYESPTGFVYENRVGPFDDYGVGDYTPCCAETTFTRQSLAKWFYQAGNGDLEKAKILDPSFTPDTSEKDARVSDLIEQNKKLLEENERLKKELLKNPQAELGKRDLSKPFELIRQLINIIEPEANLQKHSQLHSLLNGKLVGEEELVVSRNTLKTYLEK